MTRCAPRRVEVSVPATTANLGVGFDVLGLALDFQARFSFEPADTLEVCGCAPEHTGPGNLVWTSYLAACDAMGVASQPLCIVEDCPIPGSGGLGSSSACVVAGVVAAQALAGRPLDRDFICDVATHIEGHPDNVAPAVMGGLVSSYVEGGHVLTTRWVTAPELRFVCLAPPYRVLTCDARRALPSMVPIDAVSWQVGRCVAMVSALAKGDRQAIGDCCHDRIHEPYRSPLIPDYTRLRAASLAAGACAFLISGSGAAMIAISDSDDVATRIVEAARKAMPELWVRIMRSNEQGATVTVHA